MANHNQAHPQAPTTLRELKEEYTRGYRGANPGAGAMARVDDYLQDLARRAEADTSRLIPNCIGLPMSSQPVYESGAILFAYLAFPGPNEEKERTHAMITLCSTALHMMAEKDPASVWVPQLIKPGYLLFPEQSVDRVLRTFGRRLRDRLIAALMAFPLLKEAETGRASEMPPGVTRLSVAQLATYAAEFSAEESPVNVQSRVWAPSLPVIHLAMATVDATRLGREAGAMDQQVHLLCCNPHFIRIVVAKAEKYERLLPLAPQLQLALERLVRFRLV